ncbi:phage tail protein [Leifsonia sp. NPDC058194]|uniref:phage tail protein n=1 Tax=Leifsonia sp. NPDC058194 TaxID=3346374 RepID=UPI0036DD3613
MSFPYMGEIRLASFNFAPKNWALCNGQTLPINQNQALFSLLGTLYGGDGRTTFNLPNLMGRVPLGFSDSAYPLGQAAGEAAHTLTLAELPQHTHPAAVAAAATVVTPTGTSYLAQPGKAAFAASASGTMSTASVSTVGGAQPHNNLAPSLAVSFIICLNGMFPNQN